MLHVALHVQAVALARSRQRMSAATAVFIGLWQRLGQLLGRESVGETTSKANCRGSGQRSGARERRRDQDSGPSLGKRANLKVPCAAGRTRHGSNHLLERPLRFRRRRGRRPLAGSQRGDLRAQRRVLALQRTSFKRQRREVAARPQGGPLVNGRRDLVPRPIHFFRPLRSP